MNRTFYAATGIDLYPTTDFNPFNTGASTAQIPSQNLSLGPLYSESAGATVTQSDLMRHVWRRARREWTGRFGV
jgi:hypothetical protein